MPKPNMPLSTPKLAAAAPYLVAATVVASAETIPVLLTRFDMFVLIPDTP